MNTALAALRTHQINVYLAWDLGGWTIAPTAKAAGIRVITKQWGYQPVVVWDHGGGVRALGDVRVRVTPVDQGSAQFVGIAPSADVDRYLAGVSHTEISDFWSNRVQTIGGGAPAAAPGIRTFWVAAASGQGTQTVTWKPANGSWSVVVMNADGRPGIVARADLGATLPLLLWIAVGLLVVGAVFAVGAVVLISAAIRRAGRATTA